MLLTIIVQKPIIKELTKKYVVKNHGLKSEMHGDLPSGTVVSASAPRRGAI
jgi:hypothetical protein